MTGWGIAAIVAGGLFTGAVVFFASVRVPQWKVMDAKRFLPDFARTIDVADKVQPTLLVTTIAALAMFLGSTAGDDNALAMAATAGFVVTMVASLTFMVPLQRRMIRRGTDPAYPLAEMKTRWIKGHYGRTFLAVTSFLLLTVGVTGIG